MFHRVRRAALVVIAISLPGGIAPGARLRAQDPRLAALDAIRAMGLDSIPGVATVYFRPADRGRALELQAMMAEYLGFWRSKLESDIRMRVAVLTQEDWKRVTPLPYAFPNNLGPPANLILAPATPPPPGGLDTLLAVSGRDRRDWLLIGHEGGHILTWLLLPRPMLESLTLPPERTPEALEQRYERVQSIPGWYWEFAASYFATAFLEASDPADAAAWTGYHRALSATPTPRFTHLDDWFGELMRATAPDGRPYFLSSEGAPNFGWYQGVVGLMGVHVLRQRDADLISGIRRMVSGEASPTTPEIVEEIEAMAPGARALLDSLGVGYGGRGGSTP